MWQPASTKELVDELRAHARDFRNWVDLIEGAIKEFEDATDQITQLQAESPDAVFQQLLDVWSTYESRSTADLAEAHGYIETWARAIRAAS